MMWDFLELEDGYVDKWIYLSTAKNQLMVWTRPRTRGASSRVATRSWGQVVAEASRAGVSLRRSMILWPTVRFVMSPSLWQGVG